jgi:hypothetical protein
VWGGGYGGRYPDRPGYGKPPRHNILDKDIRSPGKRRHYGRGNTPSGKLAEVRKPQRLGNPEVEKRKTRTTLRGRGVKGKEAGRVQTKDIKQRDRRDKRPDKLKAKVSRRGDGGRQKNKARVSDGKPIDRSKTKGEVRKGKKGTRSKVKVSKRGVDSRDKSKGKSGSKSKSKSKAKGSKQKVKSGSKSKSRAKASDRKAKSKSKSKRSRKAEAGGNKTSSKK